MSNSETYKPEGYQRLGALAVYFVEIHQGSSREFQMQVGIGTVRYPEILLPAADALRLLAWLTEHKAELEAIAV